jgi:hypothetical protein
LGQRNRKGQIPVAMMDIISVGAARALTGATGLFTARSPAGRFVIAWVLLRIGRLDTIGPADPVRQVEPGQHSPARG